MRWKWIFGIAAGLTAALIVTAYVVVSRYDFNELKPRITRSVKKITGRELTLSGDISLQMGLTPALVVEEVGFQNASWGSRPEMIRMKRFEVELGLLSLIFGDLDIKQLIVVEPDILLETDGSGRSNLSFSQSQPGGGSKPGKQSAAFPLLVFRHVEILKGKVTFRDGQKGRDHKVAVERLAAAGSKGGDRIDLELKAVYGGTPVEIQGMTGTFGALLDPSKTWKLDLTARAAQASVTVAGTVRDPWNAKGLDLTMTVRAQSLPALAALTHMTGLPEMGPLWAQYRITDPQGRLTLESLDVTMGTMGLAKIDLKATITDPLRPEGVEIDFLIQGEDLSNLQKITGRPLPLKGAFMIQGRLADRAPGTYTIAHLSGALGGSLFEGFVEMALTGKRPQLDAHFFSEAMDLRPILAKGPEKGGSQMAEQGKPKKIFPGGALPLNLLRRADARIKFHATSLLLPRLALKNAEMDMVLQKGRLTIDPVKASVGDGRLHAYLILDSGKKAAHAEAVLKVEKLDLRKMLGDLGCGDSLEGTVNLDVALNGQGSSIARIMGGAHGHVVAVMGKGRIHTRYIDMLGGDVASSLKSLVHPSGGERRYTRVNCLVSRFDIQEGTAEATVLVMDTPLTTIAGGGHIDLKTEALDLALKPSPKKGVAGLSMSVSALAKPFRLSGTLADPSLGVDPMEASLATGKAVGGFILLGPLGILAAMTGKSSGETCPCLAAIEAAGKGPEAPEQKRPQEDEGILARARARAASFFGKLTGR
jgi:uncharacterized protein involved in outer membrane biogenesis